MVTKPEVKQYDWKQRKLFYSQRLFCKNNFFTEHSLLRYFSELVCFNQNSALESGNNGIFWFLLSSVYCYCGDYYCNFSDNLKDSLMIYICGKFELPNYKSKVEIRTSSFSPRMTVQRWRHSQQWWGVLKFRKRHFPTSVRIPRASFVTRERLGQFQWHTWYTYRHFFSIWKLFHMTSTCKTFAVDL